MNICAPLVLQELVEALRITVRRQRSNPWVREIPWRRKWQPTPVFLPGKSHGRGAWQVTVHGVAKSQPSEEQWVRGLAQPYAHLCCAPKQTLMLLPQRRLSSERLNVQVAPVYMR